MAATIFGATPGGAKNLSEYAHVKGKWLKRPGWLEEVESPRERTSHTEAQAVRTYLCPWSYRFRAYDWLLGYSTTAEVPQAPPPVGAPAPEPKYQIRREVPAQDPERPWLFCSEVELTEGRGAWVESPSAFARDAAGKPHVGPEGEMLTGAIAFVSNELGGFAGRNPPPAGFGDLGQRRPPGEQFLDGAAVLRATYRPRNYSVLTDEALDATDGYELRRYVERQVDYALEGIPMARWAANLKYIDGPYGGKEIPEAGIKQVGVCTLHYTWHEVPDPPYSAYYAALGKLNFTGFDECGGAPRYPESTLLCMPWKLDRKTGPTGRITWTIHFRFQYRPQGWNHFPAANGNFYAASFGGGQNDERVYKWFEFALLFNATKPLRYLS